MVLAGMLRGWVVAVGLGRVDGAQPGAAVIFERADHRPGADRSGAVHDGARLQELPLRDRELRPQLERRGADVGPGPAVGGDAVEQTPERRQVRHLVAQLVQAEQVGERARGPELAR